MGFSQVFSSFVVFYLLALSRVLAMPTGKKLLQEYRARTRALSSVDFLRSKRSATNLIPSGAGSSQHTATDDVLIQCKNRWFLAVYNDSTVNGTLDPNSPYIKLQLQSVGHSTVRIFSTRVGRYVAMSNNGKVYTTIFPTEDTKFRINYESTSFTTFASVTHFKPTPNVNGKHMFLSIRGNGLMRNGRKTKRHHKTSGHTVIGRNRRRAHKL